MTANTAAEFFSLVKRDAPVMEQVILRPSSVCSDRICPSLGAFALGRTATVRANRKAPSSAWLP